MKNHRLLMLIVACAVLDWLMLSSSRDQSKRVLQEDVPVLEQVSPVLIASNKSVERRHKMMKRNATAAHILAQRAIHSRNGCLG